MPERFSKLEKELVRGKGEMVSQMFSYTCYEKPLGANRRPSTDPGNPVQMGWTVVDDFPLPMPIVDRWRYTHAM